jgi:hypothetical protein
MRRFAQLSRYARGSLASLMASRVAAARVNTVNRKAWRYVRAGFESPRPTADLTASVTVMMAIGMLWSCEISSWESVDVASFHPSQ